MEGCYGVIKDRSGLAANQRVSTRAGVIDPKYPNEWCVVLENASQYTVEIKKGDRIAQVIFLPLLPVEVVGAGVAVSGDIRTGGFGSTGA
jgi:dUTP pyrophosphatase